MARRYCLVLLVAPLKSSPATGSLGCVDRRSWRGMDWRLADRLSEEDVEFSEQDIKAIDVRWIGEHVLQVRRAKEVLAARTNVVGVASRDISEGFEDSKGGLGVTSAEPWAGAGLLFHAGEDVFEELFDLIAFAWLGFK